MALTATVSLEGSDAPVPPAFCRCTVICGEQVPTTSVTAADEKAISESMLKLLLLALASPVLVALSV